MSSCTVVRVQVAGCWHVILPPMPEESHLSLQIFTDLPSPILHLMPYAIKDLVPNQLFQNHESFPFCCTWKKSCLGKYLPLRTRDINKWGSLINPYTYFASNASLTDRRSLNSSPPCALLSVSFCHLAQWIHLLSSVSPHQCLPNSSQFVCIENWRVCNKTWSN